MDMIFKLKAFIPLKAKRTIKLLFANLYDSIRYYGRFPRGLFKIRLPLIHEFSSIIFVCKGNVCRSVFAEHRLKCLLCSETVKIDSCGIDVDQGGFPPTETISVAAEFSCSLRARRSKGLSCCDIAGADLVCAMEYWQYKKLIRLYPEKKKSILLLRNFAPLPYRLFCNIADPYGLDPREFRKVFRIIDRALVQIRPRC